MKYELDEDAVAVLLEYVEEALVEIAEVLDGPQHQEGVNWTTSGMHMGRAPRFALNKQKEVFVNMRRALRNPIRCKDDVLAWPLEKLGCSQRILNALRNKCYQTEDHSLDFIRTVGELVVMTEYELSKYPELGKKSITEIKACLYNHDLYLSCTEGER